MKSVVADGRSAGIALVGVDTGGTFTDLVFLGADGQLIVHKVASTPADPSVAVARGLALEGLARDSTVVHGTTVATNALLQRRGARVGLITTRGFADVLEIARQQRDALYALEPTPRLPLVPRERRAEVNERVDWRGAAVESLDTGTVERALDELVRAGVDSVAVCLLFSFLLPDHEREVGRRAAARGLPVSLSVDIAPEYREYERTATVCANAFVAPAVGGYLARLSGVVGAAGAARLRVMQSDGTTASAEAAAAAPVRTALSGPAAGVVAAARAARAAGLRRAVTLDMGGTSTDVALLNGAPETMRAGEVAGVPLLTPMVDIHTIGAGGGSLVRVDAAGGLRVGPESAGADPGPVACGGGSVLTVTDANVLLGRIPAHVRLAGSVALDLERVRSRFADLGRALGVEPEVAAEGVLEVVNARMARALRRVSVERGHDPARYTLVAFGGAGGLHGCALADAVGLARVLVPRYPGALSALGLALAPAGRELARSWFAPALPEHDGSVRAIATELEWRARKELEGEVGQGTRLRVEAFLEMRYRGQSYALRVRLAPLADAARAFHRAHRRRYGHADPSLLVEVVAVGLAARAAGSPPRMSGAKGRQAEFLADRRSGPGSTRVWWRGRPEEWPILDRAALRADDEALGPAILLQEDATTVVEPGWRARVLTYGDLLFARGGSG
ncbi:MAG: hydantoinase/oxoprolinase family protein [Chthonomonadales bacterium]|nr:hydantoinase/oxoprolinase family protein [Chthonomonadales bacterium]